MKKKLLLLLGLFWAGIASAQTSRVDCSDLNSIAIANVTECVQTTDASGRIAGRTYLYTATNTWREKAAITAVNAQTGTTYTFLNTDSRKLVTFTNASAIAATLPQAGASSSFLSSWYVDVQNRGAGTVTITPTTSTIDGAANLALTTKQGVRIFSDGTNYFTQRGVGGSVGSETDPVVAAINGIVKSNGSVIAAAVPNTDYPAITHAARHQHGGADETATATPGGNAIPKAGAGGKLAQGWIGAEVYDGSQHYCADAGSNDTYVCSLANAPTAYATGMWIVLKPNTINTGAATVNVNSLGAKTIVQHDNSTLTDGLLQAGRPYRLDYDGTSFRMQAGGTGGSITGSGSAGKLPKFTGTTAIGDSIIGDDGAGNVCFGDCTGNTYNWVLATPTADRDILVPDQGPLQLGPWWAWFDGGAVTPDGTNCTDPTKSVIGSGPRRWNFVCPTAASAQFGGDTILNIPVATITVTLLVSDVDSSSQHFAGTFKAMCRAPTTTINSTWGSTQTVDITMTTANIIYAGTTATLTPNGTCSPGAILFWQFDANGSMTDDGDGRVLGVYISKVS